MTGESSCPNCSDGILVWELDGVYYYDQCECKVQAENEDEE